jgi:hypothetical protein
MHIQFQSENVKEEIGLKVTDWIHLAQDTDR